MNNKVLIKVYAPEFDKIFDVYIPVNYLIWKINKMLAKCIGDLCDYDIDLKKEFLLINKHTNEIYQNNTNVRDTDIRNGTELIIISQ
jgi:hypothetical protein